MPIIPPSHPSSEHPISPFSEYPIIPWWGLPEAIRSAGVKEFSAGVSITGVYADPGGQADILGIWNGVKPDTLSICNPDSCRGNCDPCRVETRVSRWFKVSIGTETYTQSPGHALIGPLGHLLGLIRGVGP